MSENVKDIKGRNEAYCNYVDKVTPKHNTIKNVFFAFIFGGLICTFGEYLVELYKTFGMDDKTAALYETLTLIALSVLFTGFGVFAKVAKFAGAGVIVPITGFANSVASSAIEFKKDESDIIGHSQKDLIDKGRVWRFSLT